MANLKIQDLEELKKRRELINSHILIAKALDFQLAAYLNELFKVEGLDINKKYEIDLVSGSIIESKEEVKEEVKQEVKEEVKQEVKEEVKQEVKEEKKDEPTGN